MAIVYVSAHADMRMKQRMNGTKSAKKRMEIAEEAYRRGLRMKDCVGLQKAYLLSNKKNDPEYAGRELVLYMDMIFVFCAARLITVLPKNQGYSKRIEKNRSKARRREKREGDGELAA